MDADTVPLAAVFSLVSAALGGLALYLSRPSSVPAGARPPVLGRTAVLALLEASARNAEEARVRDVVPGGVHGKPALCKCRGGVL